MLNVISFEFLMILINLYIIYYYDLEFLLKYLFLYFYYRLNIIKDFHYSSYKFILYNYYLDYFIIIMKIITMISRMFFLGNFNIHYYLCQRYFKIQSFNLNFYEIFYFTFNIIFKCIIINHYYFLKFSYSLKN
jgi:hypothetical protein